MAAGEKHGNVLSQVPSKIIQRRSAAGEAALGYYLYASSHPRKELPLFIAVHGIGRKAKDQARLFTSMIEAIGGTLVAPSGWIRSRLKVWDRVYSHIKGDTQW